MNLYTDEYFMREALKEAQKAMDQGEVPVGAVIVNSQKIIGRAHNQTELLNDATAHAEILCITSATNHLGSKYLSECVLYVTLEPCVMCAGAMYWSQIHKLVFGSSDNQRGYRLVSPSVLHPQTKVASGIKEHECQSLLHQFFKKIRRP